MGCYIFILVLLVSIPTGFSLDLRRESHCPTLKINTFERYDEEVLKSIESVEECSKKCHEKMTCNFWTWANKDAGKWALDCVLMSDYGYTFSDNNTISGERKCIPIGDTIKKCWSVDKSRATDQWCIDNCHHIPTYCQDDFCKCEVVTPTNGQWSSWSSWSACSRTCGSATKSRTRTCSSGSNGGKVCPGTAEHLVQCIQHPCDHTCYADNTAPYRGFGTVTSYLINANLDDTKVSVPGCKPVMLWLNARHGARGPRVNAIKVLNKTMPDIKQAILQAFDEGKSKLCLKDITNLKNWRFTYTANETENLEDAGRKEMMELGQRMRKRFPDLLKDSQKTVRKTSTEQRTHDSMKAFLMGMYGQPIGFEDIDDLMLTFNAKCQAYMNGIEFNDLALNKVEVKKLQESPEWEKMVARISDRIGVQLNWKQLDLAYRLCSKEIANFPDAVSPWCALFSESDLRLIEYSEDLGMYYRFNYYNVTQQMTQPLMADLHQKFSSLKVGHVNSSAFLYVVRSRIAHSMLATLGLYKDEKPPLASDWPTPHTLWRTSTMLSFAHNLALVALQCDDPQNQYKVLAMHNERRISLAGICGEEICPLQTFLDKIKPIVDTDFEKVCKWNDNMTVPANIFGQNSTNY